DDRHKHSIYLLLQVKLFHFSEALMTIKSKISHLSALGLAMALGLTACGGESEADNSITLQYAFCAPAGTYPGVQMQKWSEELTERTDGAVTVETFPGGTLL